MDTPPASSPPPVAEGTPPLEIIAADSLLGDMGDLPEVNREAVTEAARTQAPRATPAGYAADGKVDRKGRPFDPNIHECTGGNGDPIKTAEDLAKWDPREVFPVLNKDGKLRGRSYPLNGNGGSRVVDPAAPPPAPAPGAPVDPAAPPGPVGPMDPPPPSPELVKATAATFTALQLLGMRAGFGARVGSKGEERAELTTAWEAVIQKYPNLLVTNPVTGLVLVSVSLVLVAANEDKETEAKVFRTFDWIKAKSFGAWHWLRGWRSGRRTAAPRPPAVVEDDDQGETVHEGTPVARYPWPPAH